MGKPAAINRPLSKLIKKKQSGCSSMKNKKKRAKLAKKRKVIWKKYILPKMDIEDARAQPQPPSISRKRQPPLKRPLTGKQQRKLRKKMKRLTAPDENRMEGMKTSKVVETAEKDKDEDTPQPAEETPQKADKNPDVKDDDGQWEDDGGWEDVEMKEDD